MARGDGFESQAPDSFVIIQTTIVFLQREGGVVDDDYSSLVSHRQEAASHLGSFVLALLTDLAETPTI